MCVLCLFASVVSHFLWLQGPRPTGLLCPWDSPGKNTGVGLPCPPPGDLPGPGTEPTSPVSSALQADSLPLSPQGSPVRIITQTEISQPRVSLFSSCLQSPLFPPWSHSIPTLSSILFPLSFFDLPPTVLLIYPNLLSHSSPCPPSPFPSLGREAELEWGQASVFQTAGHDTLVGREINLVGHGINLKGSDQNLFLK